jgi:tRNA A-37 threonylcarbamoyl transferase component Bud32
VSADSDVGGRAAQRLGTVLRGKYRLDRVLGVGGMAVVYVATHRNQKQFAVKMLHPELSSRADLRARFLREGYAANSVRHPGSVAVLDDDTAEDGAAFLVMELLEGEALEAVWEKAGGRLPLDVVMGIGWQLLDVLASAHANGIVHRDIKPANLFLTREGQVKVLDFGIARVRDAAMTAASMTGTGIVLGTPAFMAPEQALARANDIDARTDVWASGATLFTLLTGQSVHLGENAPQIMILAATTPPRSLASVASWIPAPVAGVIDRALAFDKAMRWPDATSMRDALRDAHMMVLGRPLSRGPLVQLAGGSMALEETLGAPMPPAARTAPLLQPTPVGPAMTPAAGPTGLPGGTTAQPVAQERTAQGPSPQRRTGLVVLASAVAFCVAGVGAAAVARLAMRPSASAAAGMAVSAAASTATPSAAVETPAAPAPPTTSATGAPSAPATVAAPPPHGAVAPRAPIRLDAGAVRGTTPSCSPPFFFDASGNKVFKPECL